MSGLGRRVFRAVEAAQGHAFISDAIEEMPDERVVLVLRGALREARKVVRVLARFVRDAEAVKEGGR